MRVYNTLTGKKEAFVPHQENKVNMYVCGPTVYNFLHVGNMRTYVVFDTVSRYLKYRGYEVNMVQNFTDVDDKIIQRALEEGISAADVSDKYIEEALVDYNALSICKADHYPRVTEEMDEIIAMVTQLIEAGYAYVSEGHVFFDAHKSKEYGKLSKKNIDDLLSGARVEVSDIKQSPVDFVLWKPAKSGEPFWESPWGQGRPGWHIECSAMSEKYLGQIDIHGGGGDLTFPHHENEIAQSEALGKSPYAKYWMHVGMLTSGHKKMSKSLGNFFTLRELIEIQKIPPVVIRFFLLSGHYRMPMEYSEALLESAQKSLGRIENCWEMLKQVSDDGAETLTEAEAALLKEAESFRV
ncbi:MAG: cysteine--tRNA ligase, partial [Defluviitaleaceae bacterium]|nr:cysteine--tRNA ligase [Defluviitaleaceae bacterium]